MPYRITQCYLPPSGGDFPAFTQAEAGTQFSDSGGMQGWVDLGVSYNFNAMYRQFLYIQQGNQWGGYCAVWPFDSE